ncbi:MAG: protocatechuate 3,4-dioxygenase, alpha subunit [Thermoleophilaceae bacterium]|jgi:protocatechuate 3,4-dioxygenase alpha subunit|nr:protocatechuate 3,4-dioxygenase, alpha subunit [Thermoleophilaceae bacterium]
METPSQTIGPFFAVALGREESGEAVRVGGTVLDGAGEPVSDAYLEFWDGKHFARCPTDDHGHYAVSIERPQAPYIAVSVFARGLLQRLVTRIYMSEPDDPALAGLLAREEDGMLRFDIHLQGERETVFLAL